MVLNTKLNLAKVPLLMEVVPHMSCCPDMESYWAWMIGDRQWGKGGASFHPLQGVQSIIREDSFFVQSLKFGPFAIHVCCHIFTPTDDPHDNSSYENNSLRFYSYFCTREE